MSDRPVLIPDASHPIEVTPEPRHVRVTAGDRIVAESDQALALDEQGYPIRWYLPMADVDRAATQDSATTTYCPYKGEASYLDVVAEDGTVADAGWWYPQAHDALSEITDHVAWDPEKVEVELV